jgi:hypothetical protein
MTGRWFGTGAAVLSLAVLAAPTLGWANGQVTETVYSTDAVVRILIAAIGGVLAVLGVVLAFKNAMLTSDVSLSRSSVEFRKISQGVVIALLGVAVLIAGLYLLPDKTSVTDITGKEIIRSPEGTAVRH